MKGRIISVNISEGKGEKKRNVETCRFLEDKGLAGDARTGFVHRQVSLLARESIDRIRAKGLDVNAGDFAENLGWFFMNCPWEHGFGLRGYPVSR